MKKKQKGFTLIEVMVAVGLASIIFSGIFTIIILSGEHCICRRCF